MRALGVLLAAGGAALFLYLVFGLPDEVFGSGTAAGLLFHTLRFVSFSAIAGGCWLVVRPSAAR